jgi:hypothetical protein
VPRLGASAKVVAVDAARGALKLQAGLMRLDARLDEVRERR